MLAERGGCRAAQYAAANGNPKARDTPCHNDESVARGAIYSRFEFHHTLVYFVFLLGVGKSMDTAGASGGLTKRAQVPRKLNKLPVLVPPDILQSPYPSGEHSFATLESPPGPPASQSERTHQYHHRHHRHHQFHRPRLLRHCPPHHCRGCLLASPSSSKSPRGRHGSPL